LALVRLIGTRLIQLLGNLLKVFFGLHFLLFPRARFRIPKYASPLMKPRAPYKVPRTIWQTNYTDEVTLSVFFNYQWNRLMAPTFEHHFWLDPDIDAFVAEHFAGDTAQAFFRLQIGAARADFWRVLALYQHGGVYLDVDSALVCPLGQIVAPDQDALFVREKGGQITNYFIASEPNHPILHKIIERIKLNIEENSLTSVFDMTGPTALDQVVRAAGVTAQPLTNMCRQGVFVKKRFQYPDKQKKHWIEDQKTKTILK
jgi:mannosyltransferase OCH1-like enzyme